MNNNDVQNRKLIVTRNIIKKILENIEDHGSQLQYEKNVYRAIDDGIDMGYQSHSRTT